MDSKHLSTEEATEAPTFTADERVYLRPDVKLEPIQFQWYAWTHLISPAQRALNLLFRQIPLLRSFLKNPSVHISASQEPSLFGGPFVDLPLHSLPEVERLLSKTEAECERLIAFARDFKELDRNLQDSASGYSLSKFYECVPRSLCGLVEFLYDINNHPRLRLHEELLYAEWDGGGEEIQLSLRAEEQRTFFMSTPRLNSSDTFSLAMPFSDPRIDVLSRARTVPVRMEDVVREVRVNVDQRDVFGRMFTRAAPRIREPEYSGPNVRLRYFGHACVLLQTSDVSVLLDPMFAWDQNKDDGRLTFCDLPERIDHVVLSHNHQDHCSPEMLIQLRHRVGRITVPRNNSGNIADPSMKLALRKLGFENVTVLDPLEHIDVPDGRITSLPFTGEHVDLDVHSRHGIHVELKGRKFAFLVDTDGRDLHLYSRIVNGIGKDLDAMFIGMECHGAPLSWIYGPLLTKPINRRNDESRRLSGLDSERAWNVVREFNPRRIFVYAMGQEPWLRYIMGLNYGPNSIQLREVHAFLERCKSAKFAADYLFVSHEIEF